MDGTIDFIPRFSHMQQKRSTSLMSSTPYNLTNHEKVNKFIKNSRYEEILLDYIIAHICLWVDTFSKYTV